MSLTGCKIGMLGQKGSMFHANGDSSAQATDFDIENLDDSFLWNSFMIKPLVKFRSQLVPRERQALDDSGILTSAIRGFVKTVTLPMSSAPIKTNGSGLPSTLTLISRLSCRRVGTRFNSRGIDDDGNVANFVESETIYWSPTGLCFSYVQVRGSVPLFWEQEAGLMPNQQKVTITRSKEASQPAFDAHFEGLNQEYGIVHIVNLLSATKGAEVQLTEQYRHGVRRCSLNVGSDSTRQHVIRETDFDFHAETKQNGYEAAILIEPLIERSVEDFAYYLIEEVDDPPAVKSEDSKLQRRPVVILQQEGVFRTNCLDCLDRTNLIQTIISRKATEGMLLARGEVARQDFWMRHSVLWADNGDALSTIYAGTGALKSSFTRSGKSSLSGALADFRKSATRLVVNNFFDKDKQTTIDMLLGRLVWQIPVALYDPINDYVNAELNKHSDEFSSTKIINIHVGTFNLNGQTAGLNEDLSSWLCPNLDPSTQPEIVVVGFQEIVELSPQQIMNSDPNRRRQWETAVKSCLNNNSRKVGGENYVMLRSGQLVGAALCIFVKSSSLKAIKNVEGSIVKTGASGMAGNKGAVAIRMDYESSKLCFVTAHLAAGFSNYDDRNRDYRTISDRLRFQKNRSIDDHDTILWLGDFNYRIGMDAGRVRTLIQQQDLEALYENDQLNIQMVAGLTFQHYAESKITFMPTYKFDLGTDTYDTSEKSRIPAWTDRILRKGSNIRQMVYNSAPLTFSDHRPVYGQFQCTISVVDEAIREELSKKFFARRKSDVGGTVANSRIDDTDDDDDLIGYDAIEPGLPPASSDKAKWWIGSGQPARSEVKPPSKDSIVNPDRAINPFGRSDESDWVQVSNKQRSYSGDRPQTTTSTNVSSQMQDRLSNNNSIVVGRRALPPAPLKTDDKLLALAGRPKSSYTPPQPLRPRTDSSASVTSFTSASSSVIRKPAPPITKKPAHLTSPPITATSSNSSSEPSPQFLAQPPIRSSTQGDMEKAARGTSVVQPMFPPPSRRVTVDVNNKVMTKTSETPRTNSRSSTSVAPPTPQPRRGGTSSRPASVAGAANGDGLHNKPKLPSRPVDLLGDDDASSVGNWTALRPTKDV